MLGNGLLAWFQLFHGVVIYRPASSGGHTADGWLNWSDIEQRFIREKLTFGGKPYDAQIDSQRDQLLDAIVDHANALVFCKLLEKRRQTHPPSLDYRVTPFGRCVGNWQSSTGPDFRQKLFFFCAALVFKALRLKKVIAIGALGWTAINAFRFYSQAASWLEHLSFAGVSAAIVAFMVAMWALISNK